MIRLPETRGQRGIGVRMGEGNLALPKLDFDLLMLGEDEPRLEFIAVQNVVGYLSRGGRLPDGTSQITYFTQICRPDAHKGTRSLLRLTEGGPS